MGCFDGAEVCKLVGSFILTKLCDVLQRENVGLYRDDRLAVVKQMLSVELEKKRKKIIQTFKKYGLAITIKTNLFVITFLDIQFNLLKGILKPYRKPNNDPVYVHKDSNHPLQVLKELSKIIGNEFRPFRLQKKDLKVLRSSIRIHQKLVDIRADSCIKTI